MMKKCTCDTDIDIPMLPELPACTCNFSAIPGLHSALAEGFESRAEASQVATLKAIPDTEFKQICQSNCCECAEANHYAAAVALKNRTFSICGSINVIETLSFKEKKRAKEQSEALAEKDNICVLNNFNGAVGEQ